MASQSDKLSFVDLDFADTQASTQYSLVDVCACDGVACYSFIRRLKWLRLRLLRAAERTLIALYERTLYVDVRYMRVHSNAI